MKRNRLRMLDRSLRNRCVLGTVFIVVLSCLLLNAPGKDKEPPPIDSTRYDYFLSWRMADIQDLESWFFDMQEKFIRIAPPDTDEPFLQPGIPEILTFDRESFPPEFKGLVARWRNGVQVFPVTVMEDSDTLEVVFFDANGEEIYALPSPADYNPEWYLLAMYPDIYSGDFSEETIERLRISLSTSMVHVNVTLLPIEDLAQYIYNEAAVASAQLAIQSSPGGGTLLMSGSDTNQLRFVEFGRTGTNGEVVVTVEYPGAYAGGVWELFSYDFPPVITGVDHLTETFMGLNGTWDIAETNLVLQTGTNRTSWTELGQWGRPLPETSLYHRAYAACSTFIDSDGDGLSDGWEQLSSKTSPTNSDTDFDGFDDGAEIRKYGTDPLDRFSLPPPADVTAEGKMLVGRLDTLTGVQTNNVQIKSVNIGWLVFEQWMLAFEPKVITNALGVVTTNQTDDTALFEELVDNVDFAKNLLATGNDGASGINTQQTWQGPSVSIIGSFGNGDWVRFTNVNFGTGVSNLSVLLAYDGSSTDPQIEVRLGSQTGTKVGTLDVLSSGHWSDLAEQTIPLDTSISGTQTVYFVGKSTSGDIANIHRFRLFRDPRTRNLLDTFRDNYFTTNDLDNLKSLGYNCLRIPFLHDLIQDGTGTNYLDEGWARLDWVINECRKRHMWVILDLHGTPGGQNGFDHSGQMEGTRNRLWNSSDYQDRTAALWVEVARRYETNSAVLGYDLFNEPDATGAGPKTQVYSNSIIPVLDKVYDAIRSNDTRHVIFMESNFMYTNMWDDIFACPDPSDQGWTNIVYEFHHYDRVGNWGGDTGDGKFETQKDIADEIVRTYTRFSEERQVPVYIGEFMPIEMPNFDYFIRQFEANGIHWAHWNFRHWGHDDSRWPWSSWGLDYRTNGIYGSVNTNIQPNVKSDSFATLSNKLARYNHTEYKAHPYLQKVVSNHNLDPTKATERTEFYLNTFSGPDVFDLNHPNAWPWRKVATVGSSESFWINQSKARVRVDLGSIVMRLQSRPESDARFGIDDSEGCWFAVDFLGFNVTSETVGVEGELRLSAVRDEITDTTYTYDTEGVIVRATYDQSGSSTNVTLYLYAKEGGSSTYGTNLYQSSSLSFVPGQVLKLFVNATDAVLMYGATTNWSGAHGLDFDTWENGAVGVVEAEDPSGSSTWYVELDNFKAWKPNAQKDDLFTEDFTTYPDGMTIRAEPEFVGVRKWTNSYVESYATNDSLYWVPQKVSQGGSWFNPRRDYHNHARISLTDTNVVQFQAAYSDFSNGVAKICLMPESFPGEIFNQYTGTALYVEMKIRPVGHIAEGNLAFDLYTHRGPVGNRDWEGYNEQFAYADGQLVTFQVSTNVCRIWYGTNVVVNQWTGNSTNWTHSIANPLQVYADGVFPHFEFQNESGQNNATIRLDEAEVKSRASFGAP